MEYLISIISGILGFFLMAFVIQVKQVELHKVTQEISRELTRTMIIVSLLIIILVFIHLA